MNTFLYSPKYYYEKRFDRFYDLIKEKGSPVRFVKDSTIVSIDELMNHMYFVTKGIMRFYVIGEDIDGQSLEKTIWFIGPGNIFPLYSPVGHCCRFEYENQMLTAYSDVEAISITNETCRQLCIENPEFAIELLNAYADLAGILLYESLNLLRSGKRRIINFLAMYHKNLKPAGIALTQEEIATITGVTLPTVARVLKELREKNIIATKRKSIQILDIGSLEQMVSDAATADGPALYP